MNLFNLLKNKTGKLVMGAPQVAILAIGAAGLVSSAAYNVGSQQGKQAKEQRSLSSISSSYNYDGLNRRADGMLSSMNIQNREGRKGVAVGADRERLEGNRSNNDFGLSAADNLGRRVSVPGAGAAAATSATDGLGSGGVDMVEINAGSSSRASASGVNVGGVSQGAYGNPQAAAGAASGNSGGQLAHASMARASGNAFNAASGSMGGGSVGGSSGGRGGASGAPSSGSEGYQFSGAMPSGSNVVSMHGDSAGGRVGSSQFMAGGRGAAVGKGRRSLRDKENDLKDISKRSADAAKNSHRSANEGARAFLASSQNSGGMSIESDAETTKGSSADFSTPTNRKLKAIGDWGNAVDKTAEERAKDRNNLGKLLMWSFFATVVAIPLGYLLISSGKDSGIWGIVKIIAGCLVIAAAIGVAIALCVKSGQYASKWGGEFISTMGGIFGGISIAALGLTIAAAFSNAGSTLAKFFDKIMPTAKSLAIGEALSKGTEVLSKEASKSAEKNQKTNSKKQ